MPPATTAAEREERPESSRSKKKRGERKTSKKADKDGDPSHNTSKASGGFAGAIGKKGAANVALRVEKIEKYLQERFNWLGLPVEKRPPPERPRKVPPKPAGRCSQGSSPLR